MAKFSSIIPFKETWQQDFKRNFLSPPGQLKCFHCLRIRGQFCKFFIAVLLEIRDPMELQLSVGIASLRINIAQSQFFFVSNLRKELYVVQ
jgi:hypothetical protein